MSQVNVTKTFVPPYEKYCDRIRPIFKSGWFTNNWLVSQDLAKRIEDFLGVKHVVLVSNWTIALQVAYKLLDLRGEVITTPFSFVATTSSLVWEGLTPRFADIDDWSLNIEVGAIEKIISKDVSAIVPVHTFGNPCDVEGIANLAQEHGLKVVYDAAHAFGSRINGNSVLSYGDVSCVSFHSTKLFHAIEGGALIINDDDLFERARKMIWFWLDWSKWGSINELWINAKMNEFQAAMGHCVLDEIDDILSDRKRIYEAYVSELKGNYQLQRLNCKYEEYNCAYFPLIFKDESSLHSALSKLNEANIFPRRYFSPSLNTLPYIKTKDLCPNSENIAQRILCLPSYYGLEREKINEICSIIITS